MATATVQFQNVEDWVVGSSAGVNLSNIIDADDATAGRLPNPNPGDAHSVRLWNPSVPADFGSLNSLTLRVVRKSQSAAGRGDPNVHRVYSREADGDPWVQRWDGNVADTKQTDTFVVPVTTLANLQILIESFSQPAGGGDPDPPDVSG